MLFDRGVKQDLDPHQSSADADWPLIVHPHRFNTSVTKGVVCPVLPSEFSSADSQNLSRERPMVKSQASLDINSISTVVDSHVATPSSPYQNPAPLILPRWSTHNFTMHRALSTNYIVPGLLLNPVLLLWSINTILSRLLPPLLVDAAVQPPPYYTLGPSAEHPHIDIHASESLCWSYTAFIVCANLAAFGRVSGRREESRERARLNKEQARKLDREATFANGNGKHVVDLAVRANGAITHVNGACKCPGQEHAREHSEQSAVDSSSPEWTDFF